MSRSEFDAHEQLAQGARQIKADDEDLVCYRGPLRSGEHGPARYYVGLASLVLLAACLCLFFLTLALRPVIDDATADALVQIALACLGLGMAGFIGLILVGPQ